MDVVVVVVGMEDGDVTSPHGKVHFWGVWPIERHCKAWDFGGLVKG